MVDEQTSDEALLRAMQQRDMRALEVLYDRHSRLAYGLACRIVTDPSVAEDVVQEAFLNVWRQAPTYDLQRGAVRPWLMSIVHHRSVDWLRSRAGKRRDVALDLVEHSLAIPDTWQTVSARLDHAAVRAALATLPAEQQQTVELAYFAGYTQPEIATAMGVPLSTVKGRLRMAMNKLRSLLEGTTSWATT